MDTAYQESKSCLRPRGIRTTKSFTRICKNSHLTERRERCHSVCKSKLLKGCTSDCPARQIETKKPGEGQLFHHPPSLHRRLSRPRTHGQVWSSGKTSRGFTSRNGGLESRNGGEVLGARPLSALSVGLTESRVRPRMESRVEFLVPALRFFC